MNVPSGNSSSRSYGTRRCEWADISKAVSTSAALMPVTRDTTADWNTASWTLAASNSSRRSGGSFPIFRSTMPRIESVKVF